MRSNPQVAELSATRISQIPQQVGFHSNWIPPPPPLEAAEAPLPDLWLKTMTRVCKGPWPEVRGLLVKRIFNFDNNGPLKKREEFLKEKKTPWLLAKVRHAFM